jgi:SET domain-containing protein
MFEAPDRTDALIICWIDEIVGYGVRALKKIAKGEFVAAYKSDLLTEPIARALEEARLKESGKDFEEPFYGLALEFQKKPYVYVD